MDTAWPITIGLTFIECLVLLIERGPKIRLALSKVAIAAVALQFASGRMVVNKQAFTGGEDDQRYQPQI